MKSDSHRTLNHHQSSPVGRRQAPARGSFLGLATAATLLLVGAGSASAALVTYTNNDALNSSSFAAGLGATNWDSGLPPAPGNDYLVAGSRTLRTPPTNGSPAATYIFAGNSLILGDGTNGSGGLSMKCSNVVTVANLIMTNGNIANGDPGGTPKIVRIAGNISVLTNGVLQPTETNRILTVTATLSGSGNLSVINRGVVTLSGTHSYNGPLTITGTMLDMDGTVSIRPSSLIVGRDSTTANGTNYNNTTNIVRLGGSLNVGYGPADALRVGWRTTTPITNIPLGVLDVSLQPSFTANVGNLTIGYSQSSGAGTAGAAGIVSLATNNTLIATNFVMADTAEGTSPNTSRLTLGRGSNYLDTPIMLLGARKQSATVTLPSGGTLVLTNSATGRTDLTVGGNNVGTAATPTDLVDLTGGPVKASLGNLTIGQKSGGASGGVTATLTLATNAVNAVDVNNVTLGTTAGNVSGTTAALGTLNFNGGSLLVNNSLTLGYADGGTSFGAGVGVLNQNGGSILVSGNVSLGNSADGATPATGTFNLNNGTFSTAGDILEANGSSTLNVNGGLLDLQPAGDATPGGIAVDTLLLKGTITNAGSIATTSLSGTGASRSQTGITTVTGTLNPGTATTAGTLALGSLSLDPAATLRVNLTNSATPGGGVNDLLDITGDVSLNSAALAVVQSAATLDTTTPYRLANYTGEILGTLTLPSVGRYTLSLATDTATTPKHLNLKVGGSPASLLWTGAQDGSTWDVNGVQNWQRLGTATPDVFFDNDSVLFDDQSPYASVFLTANVQPGWVTVSNNVNAYAIGTYVDNGITGPGGLTKYGPASLTLNTSNTFTGPVAINAGLLVAGNSGALGATNSGTTIASGATLDVNDKSFTGEVFHVQGAGYDGNGAIINSDTLNAQGARTATRFVVLDGPTTFGGIGRWDIRGTGPTGSGYLQGTNYTVTKVGANGVYFTDGTAVTSGNLLINEGQAVLESNSTMNTNASVVVSNGAVFSFYRLANPMGRPVVLEDGASLRSTDATVTSQNQVSGTVTLNGVGYFNTAGNATNYLHLVGQVTGAGQFVKTGGSTVELLHGANNWLGGTLISQGTLSVGNGLINGSLPATPAVITNNALLMFNVASNTTVTPTQEITGTGAFRKIGDGIVALTVSNSFTGIVQTGDGASLSGGIIRLLNPCGFGDPNVTKIVQLIRGELRLEGGLNLPPTLSLQTSANSTVTGFGAGYVAIRNVAGTNTIPNTVELIGGAGNSEYSSDAGLLVFDGPVFLGYTSSRSAMFSGAGNGVVNGVLSNQDTNALTVQKLGAGTWTLTAANTYTGPTTVSAGTLLVNGSIGGGAVTVQTNGTLGGNGIIGAPVTVQLGGTLSPGTSIGTLTLTTNLTLQGKAVMEVARNGAVLTRDFVTGIATNTYGGTLIVTNVGSSPLQPGDTFKLFSASVYAGGFTNLVYPTGYTWTNNLAVDGTVGVASVVAGQPTLGYSVSGSSLTFTWTGTYKLQAQTNALTIGLSNNWADVPGGGVSGVSIPMSPASGSVFFRLIQ